MKSMIRHRAGTLGLALLVVVGACAASAGSNVTAFVERPTSGQASNLNASNMESSLQTSGVKSTSSETSNAQPTNILPPPVESPNAWVIRQACGTANVQFNKLPGMQACLASQKVSFLQSDWCAVVKTYCDAQWYPFGEKSRCFSERNCPVQ